MSTPNVPGDDRRPDQQIVGRIGNVLANMLPDVEPERRALVAAVLLNQRTADIAAATNKLARQLADQNDRHDTLRDKIAAQAGDWMIDRVLDQAEDCIARIQRLLDLDEKGLPL